MMHARMRAMTSLPLVLASGLTDYLPIAILVIMAIIFAVVNIIGAGILLSLIHN